MANPIRTKQQLNERLEEVKQIANGTHKKSYNNYGDSERAHYKQDMLLRDVLVGIANGAKNSQSLAGRALEVFNINFNRWYS